MLAVFVLLLLLPMVAALIGATLALIHGDERVRVGKLVRILLFGAGLCAVIFRPSGRITIDRQAAVLRYTTGWWKRETSEFDLLGLVAVTVEGNPSSMQRLLLAYRDGSTKPLTELYFYGKAQHQNVARALTTAIAARTAATVA
jgi:hypothetical protein